MDDSFDFFVIGAGSAGVRAARIAAQHGAKVAIAERDRLGGTCVIRGCVPKKLMVYASRFADEFELAKSFGWRIGEPEFDFAALLANKDKEIARLEDVYRSNLIKAGVTLLHEEARFEDAHHLHLASGKTVQAKNILIATGGSPTRPNFEGKEHCIVSDDIFHLQEQPKHLVIAGGGYIAVEFACIFEKFGSQVTLLKRGGTILRGFDEEMTDELLQRMRKRMDIRPDVQIVRVGRKGGRLNVELKSGEALEADQVLLATGRKPNIDKLNLPAAGVKCNEKDAIAVNKFSQTNAPHIYAVGDVTERVALTPVAIREGHAVADTLFGGKPWFVDHAQVPSAAFTTPELGHAGLTEAQGRERYKNIRVYRSKFRGLRTVMSSSDERIFLKLIVDEDTHRVLGAHMLGDGASEMAQLLAISIGMKATKKDFDQTIAVHPTIAEEWVTLK